MYIILFRIRKKLKKNCRKIKMINWDSINLLLTSYDNSKFLKIFYLRKFWTLKPISIFENQILKGYDYIAHNTNGLKITTPLFSILLSKRLHIRPWQLRGDAVLLRERLFQFIENGDNSLKNRFWIRAK